MMDRLLIRSLTDNTTAVLLCIVRLSKCAEIGAERRDSLLRRCLFPVL